MRPLSIIYLYQNCGLYLRTACINYFSYYLRLAFEGGLYLKAASIRENTVSPFPVLIYYSLVGMHVNLGASSVLILSYLSDRRKLSLSEHKLENLFFFSCLPHKYHAPNFYQRFWHTLAN